LGIRKFCYTPAIIPCDVLILGTILGSMLRYLCTCAVFISLTGNLLGQRLIYDSLVVGFGSPGRPVHGIHIDTVTDVRKIDPAVIGVNEIKRYLVIPVDRYVLLENPLSYEIMRMFVSDDKLADGNVLRLKIDEFDVFPRKQMFRTKYVTHINISLFSKSEDGSFHHEGHLLYETTALTGGFMAKPKQGYQAVLDRWKEQFAGDMIQVSSCIQAGSVCGLSNLVDESCSFRNNLIVSTEASLWYDSWLVDGEIIFSRPESQKRFYRKAYCIRYRREHEFQSLEYSISNDQFNFRISDHFLLVVKSKLFFGFNLWTGEEYRERGFEDIFLLDYSLGPGILFNPYYKRGITFGTGLAGSITFIYSEGFSVKPYMTLQLGIKI